MFLNIKSLLLSILLLFFHASLAANLDYIIDTDIGGDIDDVMALLLAIHSPSKPLAITTTHIDPQEKARIAKLILTENGYTNIPVYAGIGVDRKSSNELFKQQNPLWPPVYGYPHAQAGEKIWYEKQGLAYREKYGAVMDALNIEQEFAPAYIAKLAKQYSPNHKLIIVALGPLHNISAALNLDSNIAKNIIIYSMGGLYPKGYNWLISPEVSANVLAKVEVITIPSELIEKDKLYISEQEFSSIEANVHTQIGLAIMQDWKNWHKIDAVTRKKTQLADPVTLYLALHPEEISKLSAKEINFPCLDANGYLKTELKGQWYSKPELENKIITAKEIDNSHIHFVEKIQSSKNIKLALIAAILAR